MFNGAPLCNHVTLGGGLPSNVQLIINTLPSYEVVIEVIGGSKEELLEELSITYIAH
jgi:hypothetical protein